MSNIGNRAIVRDKYKGKRFGMKGMEEGYNSHMLDVTRICAKTGEAVTSQLIVWCWKSSGILSASDLADITLIKIIPSIKILE